LAVSKRERPATASRDHNAAKQLLSDRERSIIQFIASGQSNKQIARVLGVAPETVKTHVNRMFVKLSAETRAQAVVRAESLGILRTVVMD
jgi:LuxR family transcriptional regulator, maltose regulon positive regulatory protein